MITFTYKDYLKYANIGMFCVEEESAEYKLNITEEESTHQYGDKIFKKILSDKKEFIKFLQKYIEPNEFANLIEEDIEKYNKEFITSKFRKKESDIIYKIANRNMYILVEHQSKVDVCYEQLN